MAKVIQFPARPARKTGPDPRDPETLSRIYADCRRRSMPYPLAVFSDMDGEVDLGRRPALDIERLRDRE